MDCFKCKQTKHPTREAKNPCFPCDSCKNLYCMECSELSSSEIKCMPLQRRLLRFYCSGCRSLETLTLLKNTIVDKENIIESKNEVIRLLQEKLDQYESRHESSAPTYAAVLSDHTGRKQNYPGILIKPRVTQDAARTRQDIGQSVNPAVLKVGIKSMQTSKGGMVVVKCSSKDESELLVEAMKDSLGESYCVEMSKMRRPRVKIASFGQRMSGDEIVGCIKSQNQLKGEIEVVHIKEKRSGLNTVFCECSPDAFKKLMEMKKVCIGWERYPVYEDLDILRCFRCQGFHHKKNVCRGNVACGKCGDGHETKDCLSQTKCCRNCKVANLKQRQRYETDHEATDVECPVYKYHLEVLKNRTDYFSG